MNEWETIKRPRLDSNSDQDLIPIQNNQLPFSAFLSKSFRQNEKHPVLSDKKLIVYDLKVERPDLPVDYEENAWNRLKIAIHAIQQNQPSPESLEVLYQLCENICQYEKFQKLYELLYEECRRYTEIQFEILANDTTQGVDYLRTVHLLWKSYCNQMSQIRCLFLYLDRTYIASTTTGSIWNMAMQLFRENYIKYDEVWQKVLKSILELIRLERTGEKVDEQFLQSNIRMLMDLDLYHTSFEQQLLAETRVFYDQEGDRLVESINIFDYLQHISTRVHQESILRVKSYFDKSTKSHLQSIVETELLTKRVGHILDKCLDFFQESDYDKFSLLYRLLQKVDKLEICAKYFTSYVKTKGSFILCEHINVQEKMSKLSAFESQTDEVVDHSFEGDEQFVDGLKDGTEYFINLRANNAIKLLAKYTDSILRSEKLDEELLDKGMFIFRNLQGKDEFEVLYKRDLAKRLLLNVTNKTAEKTMLSRMKKECGAGYTGKLEGMVKDIEKSDELMNEFNVIQNAYTEFYMTKFSKRILTWQNSLSVCKVNANYPLVRHDCRQSLLLLLLLQKKS
ncbi:Cullin family-domain-containing protein [Helicostylum pulchrum]|nr:Cullin family-domain-containing protein [Helicostylum pulchrum]